jgi:hypothetical protein
MKVRTVRLGDLAHARSGDKGDRANIGVVARDRASYELLRRYLTVEVAARFLEPMAVGEVKRYELPGIHAFNFVIERALAGGAGGSTRLDTQGKALASAFLELSIPIDDTRD